LIERVLRQKRMFYNCKWDYDVFITKALPEIEFVFNLQTITSSQSGHPLTQQPAKACHSIESRNPKHFHNECQ
jgi:hypothetical protein